MCTREMGSVIRLFLLEVTSGAVGYYLAGLPARQ
jgi:hypothetical protein